MEEARFSINIRFSKDGYDSQITVRGDDATHLQGDFEGAMTFLKRNGCLPERRWENGKANGNGHAAPAPAAAPAAPAPTAQPAPTLAATATPRKPVCKKCGSADAMELISFTDKATGQQKSAYKCQDCHAWAR